MSALALARERLLQERSLPAAHGYLNVLMPSTVRMGLDRLERALKKLGDPQLKVPTVHVAGTNGKGSTCAFVSHCLTRQFKTGLYTSPHLERPEERIRINNVDIDDVTFVARMAQVVERLPVEHELTYFEFGTLLAFWHFAYESVDVAVIETGLGGRLDATNLCRPLVTAITAIDFDHMEFLGNTLPLIAAEKAGIIKHGAAVVCAQQPPEIASIFEATASRVGTAVLLEGRDFELLPEAGGTLTFCSTTGSLKELHLGLEGPHQRHNAATALAILTQLGTRGFSLSDTDLREGLRATRWPGRFERFNGTPPVILDGAHNPAGVTVLLDTLRTLPQQSLVHLVFGVFGDKNFEPMMRDLLPRCASVALTPVPGPRTWQPHAHLAMAQAQALNGCVSAHDSVQGALAAAEAASNSPHSLVLVAGSLALVGQVRGLLKSLGRSPVR